MDYYCHQAGSHVFATESCITIVIKQEVMYLLLNRAIVNIVYHDLDLLLKSHSLKCQYLNGNRMGLLRMLYCDLDLLNVNILEMMDESVVTFT